MREVTFLSEAVLGESESVVLCVADHDRDSDGCFPFESAVELIALKRVTDFFLGLNAGRWLTIRMSEIAQGTCDYYSGQPNANLEDASIEDLLRGSLLSAVDRVDDPPDDAAYLFEHYGMSNNSALPPEAREIYNKL